jgi:hypothetical protein
MHNPPAVLDGVRKAGLAEERASLRGSRRSWRLTSSATAGSLEQMRSARSRVFGGLRSDLIDPPSPPNNPLLQTAQGLAEDFLGHFDQGISEVRQAMRLSLAIRTQAHGTISLLSLN